jgi:hypothetical protein
LDQVRAPRDKSFERFKRLDLVLLDVQAICYAGLEGVDPSPVVSMVAKEMAYASVISTGVGAQKLSVRAEKENADVRGL